MTSSFEDRLLQDARCLFQGIDRVLLAVSGGADSVAMAHALVRLRQQGAMDCNFVIGHINHRLRGAESDADEAFVDQLGESLGLPVVSQRMDINKYAAEQKLSIETAGRVVRLQSLVRMAIDNGCSAVATAHHKDDLAETMIHRFMRGTGFRGLCGIWAESEVYGAKFIRPMLGLRRADIIQYSKDTSIQWREDASNRNINFTRNKIRHRLLPLLEAESRSIVDQLSMLSLETQRFQQFLKKQAQEIIGKAEYPQKRDQFEIFMKWFGGC
ncbi:MAG: tRNA lysidine(34) synthetase TilS [Planctomycetota bacterium]|jgi:tRNA(Ile)-lysidine synthase